MPPKKRKLSLFMYFLFFFTTGKGNAADNKESNTNAYQYAIPYDSGLLFAQFIVVDDSYGRNFLWDTLAIVGFRVPLWANGYDLIVCSSAVFLRLHVFCLIQKKDCNSMRLLTLAILDCFWLFTHVTCI